MSDDRPTPDFTTVPCAHEKAKLVWAEMHRLLTEHHRVYAGNLPDNADFSHVDLSRKNIEQNILPKMRTALADKDIIDVELENPEGEQGPTRKMWILAVGD